MNRPLRKLLQAAGHYAGTSPWRERYGLDGSAEASPRPAAKPAQGSDAGTAGGGDPAPEHYGVALRRRR